MSTLNLPAQVAAVRKLPLYRWLVAGVAVLALLIGAATIKTNHKTVLAPVTAIVQVAPEPLKAAPPLPPAPAPVVVQPAPKKQPAKPAQRKAAPKKV